MPGNASWEMLYKEEYRQLFEEGYPVGDNPKPDLSERYLPFPKEMCDEVSNSEENWEKAYWNLWQVREKGIREDFEFEEPEDFEEIIKHAGKMPELEGLSQGEYEERVKGAWFGRCAAVILGKPLEMGFDKNTIKGYLESVGAFPLDDWVPAESEKWGMKLREDCIFSTKGNVAYVQADDDIHYTILALLMYEKYGAEFTKLNVGENWLDNVPYHWFWCASRQAYYHMVNLDDSRSKEEQIEEIPTKINPWRECIDGQIRTDFWGYICPSNAVEAAKLAHRECSFSLVKNGVYGGMFVAGCLSGALSKNPTVESIIESGLAVIPANSRLAHAIKRVEKWYGDMKDWEAVCDKIYEVYGHLPFADTINNIAMVVLALLHGNLDYSKTITTAVMCGIDTDCNSATAGSIVGAAIGYDNIPKRWVEPLNDTVKTVVAGFGQGTITDLVERTIKQKRT